MEISDEGLVIAARSGDEKAFEELVRRHYEQVYQRIRRILRNREDALDVAQEAFLKAFRSLDQIRDGRTVRAWLGQIGVRLALNRAERDRFRRMVSMDGEEGEAEPAVREDPLERSEIARDARLIEGEIGRLPAAQRTAFHLRHFEGLPFREVAEWMGNSEATARVLYFQAVRRLRAKIEERG